MLNSNQWAKFRSENCVYRAAAESPDGKKIMQAVLSLPIEDSRKLFRLGLRLCASSKYNPQGQLRINSNIRQTIRHIYNENDQTINKGDLKNIARFLSNSAYQISEGILNYGVLHELFDDDAAYTPEKSDPEFKELFENLITMFYPRHEVINKALDPEVMVKISMGSQYQEIITSLPHDTQRDLLTAALVLYLPETRDDTILSKIAEASPQTYRETMTRIQNAPGELTLDVGNILKNTDCEVGGPTVQAISSFLSNYVSRVYDLAESKAVEEINSIEGSIPGKER
jgi:hypothetical protein